MSAAEKKPLPRRITNLERDEKILQYWPRDKDGKRAPKPGIIRLCSTLDDGKHELLRASVDISADQWAEMNSDKSFMKILRGLAKPLDGDIKRGPCIRVEEIAEINTASNAVSW